MRTFLKLVSLAVIGTIVLLVGGAVGFIALVVFGAIFGVATGLIAMVAGFVVMLLKAALMVVLPLLVLLWIVRRLFARSASHDYV